METLFPLNKLQNFLISVQSQAEFTIHEVQFVECF